MLQRLNRSRRDSNTGRETMYLPAVNSPSAYTFSYGGLEVNVIPSDEGLVIRRDKRWVEGMIAVRTDWATNAVGRLSFSAPKVELAIKAELRNVQDFEDVQSRDVQADWVRWEQVPCRNNSNGQPDHHRVEMRRPAQTFNQCLISLLEIGQITPGILKSIFQRAV
ncbi:hypothetical protein T439DRAFT_321252 [Meredithblackwellia eburnea MCA 4105]